MAKSFGIPAVKIDGFERLKEWNGKEVLIDTAGCRVVVNPVSRTISESGAHAAIPRVDDLPVRVWLNVADPDLLSDTWKETVAGIGLYRTEVLFMQNESDFPSEEAQFAVYRKLFARCSGSTVTIRTLDIGGDKTLSYFSMGPQENPYMGLRAHRIYRFHPELFIAQMRAILRAKLPDTDLRILYPMVGDVEELSFVQGLTKKAIRSLKKSGCAYSDGFRQGLLVEVPGAVWDIEKLLDRVDFASVGTNDLLQFFHGCDRNNANVSAFCRAETPGFLRMLKYLVDAAKRSNKPLGVCGEMAADPDLLPVLIGMGFENISVDQHSLPEVAHTLAKLNAADCAALANECLSSSNASEVNDRIRRFNGRSIRRGGSRRKEADDVDPVCGMLVFTHENPLSAFVGERKYHFCSKMCMDRFLSRKVPRGGCG